jgi:hypothetical protein
MQAAQRETEEFIAASFGPLGEAGDPDNLDPGDSYDPSPQPTGVEAPVDRRPPVASGWRDPAA